MQGRWHGNSDKWPHINQLVKEQKIGILCLQEMHLSDEEKDTLNSSPGLQIHVISSIDPTHPNAKGVAIIINKRLLGTTGIKMHQLIPGRALLSVIPWRDDNPIKILAIYAPNDTQQNQYFWDHVQSKLRSLPKPNIMLGDFNIVEDALDRLPPKADPPGPSTLLHELKTHLHLKDGWRHENPDSLIYTFAQSALQGGSQSRINHIYLDSELLPYSKEWDVSPPGIHTDHQLVSARISSKRMPYVGKGRWSLPLYVLKDEELGDKILDLGRTLHCEINESKDQHTNELNLQTAFSLFKQETIKLCRTTAKKLIPKKKNKLRAQQKATLDDPNLSTEDKKVVSLHIQEKLNQLEIMQHERARDH
ncbi:Endonuclease/exonuclease/phosphatase [Suillus plorans]|uniref:Endonuclease/exonuclease/phosphatase n=1 Tax=Suillus plorans TaxID=116603 RepID=A0A9P7AJG9_9AGAM|nr:Endonuclease/exonuclease/phosphatase [Suillus plorans]KAG1789814.1 Endonuclease/exonuclease/phosphatase [Suillus plorans]